ncbi:MAG: hypothetical protein IJA85_12620 [Clostridia bacterium]|nr:hypothetical protein [Clostridia bacterium]
MKFYPRSEELTGVQEASPYSRKNDLQCDFVMVYGIHNIRERIKPWKRQGYVIHLMTGVSWGDYQDYLNGNFDGREHHDEGQVDRQGNSVDHHPTVPYMIPTMAYARFLTEKLKVAVDAGVDAIHLEEPEIWVRSGYSEAFKREWLLYYKEPWRDPASSCDAQYKASRLKQYLYSRMLNVLCSELKEYALVRYGRQLRFYVPTHSLISYTQIDMVSPESMLIDLPGVDGYIAQIWTGTARVANQYEGRVGERVFEAAFLEYGIMQELVRGTGRRMWFLHDPVEDNRNRTWEDYSANYKRTVAASLLHPAVWHYEVAPWPCRVFSGSYATEDDKNRIPIPDSYRTELLTITQALRDMKQEDVKLAGDRKEIGILLADSSMYQRTYPDGDSMAERNTGCVWDSFFGLAMPLLKNGLLARPVQLDNIRRSTDYLAPYKTLVLSYEFMKPSSPDIHAAIEAWIKAGGTLIYVGDGKDSFHDIDMWWKPYGRPECHLFETLGLEREPEEGMYSIGAGRLRYVKAAPSDFARTREASSAYRELVRETLAESGITWSYGNSLVMERGPYTIASVMSESEVTEPLILEGCYCDLFKAELPIVENPALGIGDVGLYIDLAKVSACTDDSAILLAAAARIEDFKPSQRMCSFKATAPEDSRCVMRIRTKRPVKSAVVSKGEISFEYDAVSDTTRLTFMNSPDGVKVKIYY